MRNMLSSLAAVLLVATAPSVATAANLVVNGGFETEDFTGWTQVNDTSFSGVTCENFGGVAPPEGSCQAFFGPVDAGGGGILQDIVTVAGASYALTFQLANLGNPPNAFGLFWDGGFVSIDFDQDAFPYTAFSVDLTATTALTNLGFIFFHEPSFFLLDDISLVAVGGAVPEPGSWMMLIAGFGIVGATMRRRRSSIANYQAI